MKTLYLWRYTHPCDGRVTTKDRFTEADALHIFPDAERVEGSAPRVESTGHVGLAFASELVRRDHGATVHAIGPQIEAPESQRQWRADFGHWRSIGEARPISVAD